MPPRPPPPPGASGFALTASPVTAFPPGFQVKVLREDGRAAFRLFETEITQVLHFSRKEKRAGECGR